MKSTSFICLILCILSINAHNPNITTISKVKDFTMGLSLGLGALDAMPEATSCVMESTVLVNNVKSFLHKIQHIKTANITDILVALSNLSLEVISDMALCGNLPAEGKAFFANIANHFTNKKFIQIGISNIALNYDQVQSQVQMAINYIKQGDQDTDYLTAGALIGRTIDIYVNGVQDQQNLKGINVRGVKDFVKGFNKGIKLAQNAKATTCIMESKELVAKIHNFMGDIKKFSIFRVKQYLQEQGQIIAQIFTQIKSCKKVPISIVNYLGNIIQHFKDKDLIKQGIINCLEDTPRLMTDIHTSISDIKSQKNLEQAGYDQGDIIMLYVGKLHSNENKLQELLY